MAIVKKFKDLLDLDDIDVLIDEDGVSKHIIVSDMPESLPQGRSSFLIETSPFMKSGVEIQMDFIDSEGNSIYTEPVSDYLEGTARRVFIEVYNDTAPGIATLIIVGELASVPEDNTIFSDADPVPEEYEGHYNVRLTKQVIINPTAVNTQPIKFFTQPTAKITETQLGTMVRTEITGSITSSLFNIEGVPTDTDLLYKPYGVIEEEAPQGTLSETTTTPPSKQKNVKAYIETKKLKFKKGSRKNTAGKRSGFTSKRSSPAKFPYQIKIGSFDGAETFRFNTKHIGGEVHFHTSSLGNLFADESYYPTEALTNSGLLETPTFDILKEQSVDNLSPTHYTASIVDLINDQTALVELPFTNKNVNGENIVLPIFGRGEIFFEAMPTGSYAPANLVSYADVRLSNMRTFSGDVFKIKTYVKSEGGFDDYKLLAEVPLEGKELLIDSASVGQGERTGYPIKQGDIDDYWDLYVSTNGFYAAFGDSLGTATYNNSVLLDSIHLSGSINESDKNLRLQLKDDYSFQLSPGLDYTLSANVVGTRQDNTGALMMLYISGSSMYQKEELHHDKFTSQDIQEGNWYGKRLGVLEVGSDEDIKKDFGLLVHNFTPDVSGSGVLQLRVVSGQWNISDISITPADDTGFSPSFFQFAQELPASLSHKRPDKFEFLIEFYDVNNNISDTVVYSKDNTFQGTNMTITGNDNVLESSLFIGGDQIGGGMHLGGVTSTLPETGGAGADGSGFMRSVGYEGFISASADKENRQSGSYGFMIWSGSVLPASGDDYKGVGLELVGASGSFKFRTNPSIFDVRADAFFIGNEELQYMSGSNRNIEISSSLFHLDPGYNDGDGRLIIGADAIINADLTANNIRTPAFIGVDGGGNPAQSTVLNASSSINSDGFAKFASASIAGWNVTPDYIFKPISGAVAHQDITRVYLSSVQDNVKNIAEGLQLYRKDEDVEDGQVKVVRVGGLSDTTNLHANNEYGIQVIKQDSAGSYSNIMYIGPNTQEIAGWTIGAEQLTGGNMIIDKEGTIKSANYQKNVAGSGFILTAAEGGYLEVENAKIRGTMATTTFEKESVNAVGGQLYVANSTTLTSSAAHPDGNYPATETTMSVTNVTGFAANEILVLKKITDTGFNTEYVKVMSSSISNPGDDTDLTGNLYLARGYSGSTPSGQSSSSLGDSAGNATFYSGSQVIVSTGKIGTGFIRLNANPNDTSTPYMDIVERTGSAIYDTELKVRLGDLSGVAGTRNVPTGFEGFGLMSEVAFLSGSNIKLEAPTFLLGDLNQNFVSGSNSNIEISSSKFHVQPGGDTIMSGKVTATSGQIAAWSISGNNISSDGGGIRLNGNGNSAEISINSHTFANEGIQFGYNSGSPRFYAGDGSNNFLRYDTSNGVNIKTAIFKLDTDHLDIDSSTNDGTISLGSTPPLDIYGSGSYMDGTGKFLIGSGSGDRIQYDGSNLIMSSSKFFLGGGGQFVSGSNGNIEISSSKFHLDSNGDVVMNNVTASNVNATGDLSAAEGTFQDINVMGSLVPNANATGSNGGHKVVETWVNESTYFGGGGNPSLSSTFDQLEFSSWGWTAAVNSGAASGVDIKFANADGVTGNTVAQMLLTPNDDTSYAKGDPPVAFFKSIAAAEGRLYQGGDRPHLTLYDANMYHNYYGNSLGGFKGCAKMGVDFIGASKQHCTITSDAINIPLTQSDIFECFLEFATRDAGNFGGFYNAYQLDILKASDDSVLYSDGWKGNGVADWKIINLPLVSKAGLVSDFGSVNQGDQYTIIDEIKIRLKVGGFTTSGVATYQGSEVTANYSGGGGTMDGYIITEMRMRRAPYVAALETEQVVISDIYSRAPNTQVTTRGIHKALTRFQAPKFRGSDSDTYIDTSTANLLKFYANGNEVLNLGSAGARHPNQDFFLVRPTSDVSNYSDDTDTTVVFGTEIIDQGSNFGSNTFTAARAGAFCLMASLQFHAASLSASVHYVVKIVTSNRTYIKMVPGNALLMNLTFSVIADMDQGDTAHVVFKPKGSGAADSDAGSSSSVTSFFCGYALG